MSKFVKILSIEAEFNTLEMLYKEFIDLEDLDAILENINHKFTILNNASELYDGLIKEHKKDYKKEESKYDDSWKQNYNSKNLKSLNYQPVILETKSLSDENESDLKQLQLNNEIMGQIILKRF